jgi:hypothetical protein
MGLEGFFDPDRQSGVHVYIFGRKEIGTGHLQTFLTE